MPLPAPEKPGVFQTLRKKMNAARKDRAFLKERRRWEKAQKASGRKRDFLQFLDLPGEWLARRRAKKSLRADERQFARHGAALPPPQTLAGRMFRAFPARFAAEDREKLWQRIAGAFAALAAALLVCCLLIYFRLTPTRPLVTVGSRVIQKGEYQAELDAAAGKPVLTKMVFAALIGQAAAKAGVTPTPGQIDVRLSEMALHGTTKPEDMDTAHFRERVGLSMALENLRTQGIGASEAEIADFYRKHAAQLAQPGQSQTLLVMSRTEFEAEATAGLLAKGATAAELAAMPDRQVDGENGFHLSLNSVPPQERPKLRAMAHAMRSGQITTVPFGTVFLTIKCLHKDAPNLPPLSQIRDEVAAIVKLSKAPSADTELARLYQANRPNFDIERYRAYFDGVDHADLSAPAGLSPAAP